jgi:hypothetical protein
MALSYLISKRDDSVAFPFKGGSHVKDVNIV